MKAETNQPAIKDSSGTPEQTATLPPLYTIKQWPEEDRPREKLLRRGAVALTDAELLAIFLRTGSQGRTALDLARDLLEQFKGLHGLFGSNQAQLCEAKGMGPAKYAQLQAVLELSRRYMESALQRGETLTSPELTRSYLRMQLYGHDSEVFACIFLDNKHRVICFEKLFFGTVDSAGVHPREVIKKSLQHNAAAVIFAHNHPSGVAEPSRADIEITKRLKQILQELDVRVLDHFIIGEGEPVSFTERGLL